MRLPYAFQGLLFVPALIMLVFILKVFCPESAGEECFADYFAVPIFLPLIVIYKIFGDSTAVLGQEFLFILLYWGAVGFFIGLIFDLYTHPSPYSPEQHLLPSQTSGPGFQPPSQV